MSQEHKITGKLVDIHKQSIYGATIFYEQEGKIQRIERNDHAEGPYILPGFVDSHIHIESSMLTPQNFAREAVQHGTIGTISDPHEIANVLGEEGIDTMLKDAAQTPFKFFFGVPSCVPATPFETSGAVLDSTIVDRLLQRSEFYYLAEMMNFPGVIHQDPEVMKKLASAQANNKPIDGHVPGLQGKDLDTYIQAGITTDHECGNYDEAVEKIKKGMKIQIREGSAARDFDNLYALIDQYPDDVMLCSDDKHPDDLIQGHINRLVKIGLDKGLDLFHMLKAAILNPVAHYKIPVGLLRENDPADFILVDDLTNFQVKATYINGTKVFDNDGVYFKVHSIDYPNIMNAKNLNKGLIQVSDKNQPVKVIEARDRTLYTSYVNANLPSKDGLLQSDLAQDILKIVVLNRYQEQAPSIGFIKNFGLQHGALATSVAHDSHNIICVGVDDASIVSAVNEIIRLGGGNVVLDATKNTTLPLEFGGLMADNSAETVAKRYTQLNEHASLLGCKLDAPFMTLAFMALPVIPELKITDQGLFDVNQFQYTSLYTE